MTFQEYSLLTSAKISKHLSLVCYAKKSEKAPKVFHEQGYIDSLEAFALRGKLIRGTLFLLICEGYGQKIDDLMLNIACGIELMHSALLIQDDVIDNDRIRRGNPTIFSQYEDYGSKINAHDPYHFGVSSAIVVADVAFFMAVELISKSNSHALSKLLQYYSNEVYLVSLAEGADSLFGLTDMEPGADDIYAVYKYKTARYTFSLPFEMAAIVCGVSEKTRLQLSNLGENAGIIFQLKDDELGLFGDEMEIGKPVGSDIRENKKTLIRLYLFDLVNNIEKKELQDIFGKEEISEKELRRVRQLVDKYRILEKTKKESDALMDKALKIFNQITFKNPEFKNTLLSLLEYNLKRKN